MEWLNYHHLLYFWTVARNGSIARAGEELRLSQPTLSTQIKKLEETLGVKLFERQGRRLVLTDVGRTVQRYADEIFRTGRELQLAVKGLPTGQRPRLAAGVADVIPKIMAELLLRPALEAVPDLTLACREGPLPQLMAALSLHELDVVLSDTPAAETQVKAFSHPLGESGVSFLAEPQLAAGLRRRFPRSLDGAPALLPARGTALRRDLEAWFEGEGVRPLAVAEFDDTALLTAFGRRGLGFFAAPTVIAAEVCAQLRVAPVGRAEEVRERYFAVSVERRLRHPAVVALADAARSRTFR
ncbi:LysR family transcriptional regulator [Anaeromyxobacter diazotrophicus]|uniref:LysR family transcriptional regulator n=1 Tax=Anaeromyxobacter diazotrophicus TaxID=2590199 RepID=UPI0015918222|nr:LysR family transcriptional regulator [Anaeromyxobacter diazotrophicus]